MAIHLEPKKHAGVDIVFKIDNVIRGKVLDPNGDPMYRVCVYLWAKEQKDGFGPSDCTNENGEFEITSVPSGEYIAVVNREGKLSSDEPFRTLFYPNVSERERAAVITIVPGEKINDINIVVPKLEETITLEGG
ncbi:MAG: carboxypeptidase-like regulatory domain-containing protein, partial [Pyrinomonadaceae bacterium]